jgi:trigger factor
MTVQVPAERIEDEVTNRLRNLAGRVKMDGFRPGKAPFKAVQRRYDGQVRQEVIGDVVQSTLQEALLQEKLRPAAWPKIEPKNAEPGEAFEYYATFEVYPEIELAPLSNITIERPKAEVTDEDIDKLIEKLRLQRVTWSPVEREAKEEDQVVLNFKGMVDGEAFQGGEANDVPLVLGSKSMIEGFEDQLIGVKAGEHRTLNVKFPDGYASKELAGKDAVFEVDVTSVNEAVLPEVDDDFVKSFEIEGTVEDLRNEIRDNMQRELDQAISANVKQQVMDALVSENKVEMPKALVEDEIDRIMQQIMSQQSASQENLNLPRHLFEEQAEKRVALGLLIAEVAQAENITVDPQRVKSTLDKIASTYEHPEEVLKAYRENTQMMSSVEALVLEEQVVDALLDQCTVNDKPATFDELVNKPKNTNS